MAYAVNQADRVVTSGDIAFRLAIGTIAAGSAAACFALLLPAGDKTFIVIGSIFGGASSILAGAAYGAAALGGYQLIRINLQEMKEEEDRIAKAAAATLGLASKNKINQ